MKTFYILFILLFLLGCPDQDEIPEFILKIENNSQLDLIYNFDKEYPDTSLWELNPFNDINIDQLTIKSGSVGEIGFFINEFSEMDPTEKIRLFLFDKESILSLSWDTITANRMYLQKYFLDFDDLESLNWKITYP